MILSALTADWLISRVLPTGNLCGGIGDLAKSLLRDCLFNLADRISLMWFDLRWPDIKKHSQRQISQVIAVASIPIKEIGLALALKPISKSLPSWDST
jgi:hypothetical protein